MDGKMRTNADADGRLADGGAMEDAVQEGDQIRDTDIVFECSHCGKSLAIDYRAAGLTIPCTDCKRIIDVPIPEGMELGDLDVSAEDVRGRNIRLRDALGGAQGRLKALEATVKELRSERAAQDQARMEHIERWDRLRQESTHLRKAVKEMSESFERMSQILSKSL
jgi:hypothetical protein